MHIPSWSNVFGAFEGITNAKDISSVFQSFDAMKGASASLSVFDVFGTLKNIMGISGNHGGITFAFFITGAFIPLHITSMILLGIFCYRLFTNVENSINMGNIATIMIMISSILTIIIVIAINNSAKNERKELSVLIPSVIEIYNRKLKNNGLSLFFNLSNAL